jgi:hypothetical protein
MGAVDTMEDFFERLNAGDREGAVALMDEKTEMRVHVGDSVQTLRGIEREGGWFLRGDRGLRMIPGDVRDLGNTYQADVLVVRPGAPTHLDASVGAKITAINIARRGCAAWCGRWFVATGSSTPHRTGCRARRRDDITSPTVIQFGF